MSDKTCTMGSSSTHHITSNRDNRRLQRSAGGSFKSRLDAAHKPSATIRTPHKGKERKDYAVEANVRANEKIVIYAILMLLMLGFLYYLL